MNYTFSIFSLIVLVSGSFLNGAAQPVRTYTYSRPPKVVYGFKVQPPRAVSSSADSGSETRKRRYLAAGDDAQVSAHLEQEDQENVSQYLRKNGNMTRLVVPLSRIAHLARGGRSSLVLKCRD
ncbi:MAG TPA: hypothetical protein VGT41_03565 [Candidatus Babeliales bacterium]|nr:hypothetical protein [Candidatus Babeliales bacterium]